MIHIEDKSKCSGCHACMAACPKNCITMVRDQEGFLYPQVETGYCVDCGICEKACPVLTPLVKTNCPEKSAYAAVSKDENIRRESSSGGMFTELAEFIIGQKGVVFGASFGEDFQVKHIAVEHAENLGKLRGSKYVQSSIGSTYAEAKGYLEAGRQVLFTGTPCQIAGLHSYLKKEYNNLITADIICHGVPSPMVWEKYLRELGTPNAVSFRSKRRGWRAYSVCIQTDKKRVCQSRYINPMIRVFLANLCLRPSCYTCAFKGENRTSDLTLADFWGVENVCPQLDDDKGTSLLILHTEKARELLQSVKESVTLKEVEPERALKTNGSYYWSAGKPEARESYMQTVQTDSFQRATKKYCKVDRIKMMKNEVKSILRKMGMVR